MQKHEDRDVSPHDLHFVLGSGQLRWKFSLLERDSRIFRVIEGVFRNSLEVHRQLRDWNYL